jgi:hypothetical protein
MCLTEQKRSQMPLDVSDGAKTFASLVQKATGKDVPVFPLHRALIMSTDDTTVFTHAGIGNDGKDEWRLSLKSENGDKCSFHRPDNVSSSKFNGLNDRMTIEKALQGS